MCMSRGNIIFAGSSEQPVICEKLQVKVIPKLEGKEGKVILLLIIQGGKINLNHDGREVQL